MIPAGYLYKKIELRPVGFQGGQHIVDICSLSSCISEPFIEYINHLRHNELSLFDDPQTMRDLAQQEGVSLEGQTLLYIEVHPEQFDETSGQWSKAQIAAPSITRATERYELLGFDVVSHSVGDWFECSPMSCNGLYQELEVNSHCLFQTLDAACAALESGAFKGGEPGPYRVYSVAKL